MPISPDTAVTGSSQAFVLRMRIESPTAIGTGPRATVGEAEGRLHIRVEHVNTADVSQHAAVEDALTWLRDRMMALLGCRPPASPTPHGIGGDH